MLAPRPGVCVLMWALGAPPVVRVAGLALCHCEGRLRSGALPLPAARRLGLLWGSAIRLLRARVRGRGGPALSVTLACMPCGGLRAVGVVGGRPWGVGRPPSPVPRGVGPGLRGPGFPGAVVVGVGIQHRPLSMHVPLRAVVACCRMAGGRPRVGALCCCEGRLDSGAVPPPARYPRAPCRGRALFPWLACPAGSCVPLGLGGRPGGKTFHRREQRLAYGAVPQPAARPLRGGWPGFRDPCAPGAVGVGLGIQGPCHRCEGRPDWGALPLRLPGLGRGCAGARAQDCSPDLPALWGSARRGDGGGLSQAGVALHCCEGRLASGAVPPPAPRPVARAAGAPPPVCPGAVGVGVGTHYRSCSVRSCEPLLRAVRVAGGRPRGGAHRRCEGRASAFRCFPSPGCPPSGRAVGVRHPRAVGAGVWVWGPTTVPLASMPRRWWGAVPGGVPLYRCEGRLDSGSVPPPAARPFGRASGAAQSVCPGCGWCARGGSAAVPQRAPLRAVVACCGGGRRASPKGLPFDIVRGVQALFLPRLPDLRAGCRSPLPTCCGRGCPGVGARHCPLGLHALWGAACHAGGGVPSPGGLASHRCEGCLVSGAVPPPAARPLRRAARVLRPVCPGCGWCGRGDPAPAP